MSQFVLLSTESLKPLTHCYIFFFWWICISVKVFWEACFLFSFSTFAFKEVVAGRKTTKVSDCRGEREGLSLERKTERYEFIKPIIKNRSEELIYSGGKTIQLVKAKKEKKQNCFQNRTATTSWLPSVYLCLCVHCCQAEHPLTRRRQTETVDIQPFFFSPFCRCCYPRRISSPSMSLPFIIPFSLPRVPPQLCLWRLLHRLVTPPTCCW